MKKASHFLQDAKKSRKICAGGHLDFRVHKSSTEKKAKMFSPVQAELPSVPWEQRITFYIGYEPSGENGSNYINCEGSERGNWTRDFGGRGQNCADFPAWKESLPGFGGFFPAFLLTIV